MEFHKKKRNDLPPGRHYHAYVILRPGWSTRNVREFDLGGKHPHIDSVRGGHQRTWWYVRKDHKKGSIMWDGIPKGPNPKGHRKKTPEQVFTNGIRAESGEEMLKIISEGQPLKFATCFSNIKSCADYLFPRVATTEYFSPEGLQLWPHLFPEVQSWIDSYLPGSATSSFYREPTPALTITSGTTTTTEGGVHGTGGEGDEMEGYEPDVFSDSGFTEPDSRSLSRYGSPEEKTPPPAQPKPISRPQARPKSLILWGGTRLGKTLFARALGRHTHFGGLYNMTEFDPDCEYAIFDDMEQGFKGFDYKNWIGGQHQFVTTDKYKHKKTVTWGRPVIYISNLNPFDTAPPGIDLAWLAGNTVCVEIDQPMCNLAASSQS